MVNYFHSSGLACNFGFYEATSCRIQDTSSTNVWCTCNEVAAYSIASIGVTTKIA
jgi:hypothetical protein